MARQETELRGQLQTGPPDFVWHLLDQAGAGFGLGAKASRKLKRMAATPRQLTRSGISRNKTIPQMTAMTSRSSVYGPRLEALACLTATIPKYIPMGPNIKTPDNQGQTSGSGTVLTARTGRLNTTAMALT